MKLKYLILTLAVAASAIIAAASPNTSLAPQSQSSAAPPKTVLLAEDVYKNIQVFKGKPATAVLPAMLALRDSLGVECSYCHTPLNWEREDNPQKQKARQMFELTEYINHDFFPKDNKVSCWTCHRGKAKPAFSQPDPNMAELAARLIAIPAGSEKKPAEQVFKNIQLIKGVPAQRLPFVMAFFSTSLGVTCAHCHVEGAYEKEKPEKQRAREMLSMVHDILHKFYSDNGPVSCYGCHYGQTQPELERSKQ